MRQYSEKYFQIKFLFIIVIYGSPLFWGLSFLCVFASLRENGFSL